LPLITDEETIGVLWVHYKEPQLFPETTRQSLQSFANLAASGYQKAGRENLVWNKLTESISRTDDPDAVLEQVFTAIQGLCGMDMIFFWEYDSAEAAFLPVRVSSAGLHEPEKNQILNNGAFSDQLARKILREKYLDAEDLKNAPSDKEAWLNRLGVRSYQGIWVEAGGEHCGALLLCSRHAQSFREEDMQQLSFAAQTLVRYLQTSRDLKESKEAVQVFREIARVSAEGRLAKTLQTIVDQARRLIRCDVVTLYVYDEFRSDFTDYASSGDQTTNSVLPPDLIGPESACYRIIQLEGEFSRFAEVITGDSILEGGFTKMERIHSGAGLQLRYGEKKVGVMFVNYRRPRRFRQSDRDLLEQFANQAAVAIYNRMLHERSQSSAHAIQALYDTGQTLFGRLWQLESPEEVYAAICESAIRVLGGDPARRDCISHIMLREADVLNFAAASPSERLPDLVRKVGRIDLNSGECKGIVGKAVERETTINASDVSDPEWKDEYISYSPRIRSQLSVPLKVGNRVTGALSVENEKPAAFTEENVHSIELLAGQLGLILQNWQKLNLLQGLIKSGEMVSGRQELRKTLDGIAEMIRELFKCDLVTLFTFDQKDQTISYPMTIAGEPYFRDKLLNYRLVNAEHRVKLDLLAQHSVLQRLLEHGKNRFADVTALDHVLDAGRFAWREDILSSAGLLLKVNQEIVGFLFLNYRRQHHFLEEEQKEIELFAQYAAIAIKAASEVQKLWANKGLIEGHTTLAWLTILRSAFSHKVFNMANSVVRTGDAIQKILSKEAARISEEVRTDVKLQLSDLYQIAEAVKTMSISPPLPSYTDCQYILINQVVGQVMEGYSDNAQAGTTIKINIPAEPIPSSYS
jgi:GAF domain-containing protein